MKEARRRTIRSAARRLTACETALENARLAYAAELRAAVDDDGASLGEVSKMLSEIGRPISRQRVYQIINPTPKENN